MMKHKSPGYSTGWKFERAKSHRFCLQNIARTCVYAFFQAVVSLDIVAYRPTQKCIWVLFSIFALGSVPAYPKDAEWISQGAQYHEDLPLCTALVERLNSLSPRCWMDALETFPEFEQPPWKTLNPSKHLALIAKLNLVAAEGTDGFAQDHSAKHYSDFLRSAKEFVAHGGKLQVWHTHLISYFDGAAQHPAPPGDQTVVLMSTYSGPTALGDSCPGKSSKDWVLQTFIALPDLSGPDVRVRSEVASVLLHTFPVIYHGDILLISKTSVFKNYVTTGVHGGVCNFIRSSKAE